MRLWRNGTTLAGGLLGLWLSASPGAQPAAAPSRTVNWDRARSEMARYRATVDNSGLVDVDAYISPRVDAEDLDGCAAPGPTPSVRRAPRRMTPCARFQPDAIRSPTSDGPRSFANWVRSRHSKAT